MIRILLLEDNPRDEMLVRSLLEEEGLLFELRRVQTGEEFAAALKQAEFDIVISDYSLPSYDGLTALALRQKEAPEIPFVLFSGTLGEQQAVESLKKGATDYLVKNHADRLGPAVRRALQEAQERNALKRAEQNLRQRDELLRRITEHVEDLIAVLSLDGRRVFSSPSYGHLLDDPERLVGTDSFADIHPEDRERVRHLFQDTLATGIGHRTEYRLMARDGRIRHVESQGTIIRNENHDAVNLLVVSRDVTGRNQAEERLKEQAALLDMARDAIYVIGPDACIIYWNKGAEQLHGWTAAEAVGQKAHTLLSRSGSSYFDGAIEIVRKKGEWVGEVRCVTKDAREIIVDSRWSLVRDKAGQPKAALVIDTDITEKKKIETQFLRAQRMESIGQLTSGIAHDLNNILSPILMSAPMLRMGLDPETFERTLATLETSAKRGANLVKQLLSFGRGAEGERVIVQLKHLIQELIKMAHETFPKNLIIESRYPGDLWTIQGDPTQLHQVLLNLCVNARDATPSGGTISVGAENLHVAAGNPLVVVEGKPGPHVVLSVDDTGDGIPAAIVDRIFDPFFTTKESGKGTGLGLSTVLGIVKSHGGFIRVHSEPGKGSSFKVYLPALPDSMTELLKQPTSLPPGGQGETVLVVDDEKAILNTCKRTLEAHGYKVLTAVDGIDALNLYAQRRDEIDLVLADIMMPFLDGAGLVRALKRLDGQVKIIVASGIEGKSEHKHLLEDVRHSGITEILEKPYTTEKLLRKLHGVLQDEE